MRQKRVKVFKIIPHPTRYVPSWPWTVVCPTCGHLNDYLTQPTAFMWAERHAIREHS